MLCMYEICRECHLSQQCSKLLRKALMILIIIIIQSYTENHFSLFKVMFSTPLKVVKIHGTSDLFGLSYGTKSCFCLV